MEEKNIKLKAVIVTFLIILLLAVITLVAITISKVSIFNSLISKSKETEKSTNYHIEMAEIYGTTSPTTFELYVNNNNYYSKQEQSAITSINYRNGNEDFIAISTGEAKLLKQGSIKAPLNTFSSYMNGTAPTLKDSLGAKVYDVHFADKDCYEIRLDQYSIIWVEKDTGLILRETNMNATKNYSYEFNTVTDANMPKPDLTGYTTVD